MNVYIPLATDSLWTVGQMAKVCTKKTCQTVSSLLADRGITVQCHL